MPNVLQITSSQNPRFKALLQLRTSKHRRRTGLFLIDGEVEIARAIASGIEIQSILGLHSSAQLSLDFSEKIGEFLTLSEGLMAKLAYGERTQQLIAVASIPSRSLSEIKLDREPLVLVLDQLEKPGNIGACLRTAAAAGVKTTILSDTVCDIWNPNVIRASRGAVFGMGLAIATGAEARSWLAENQIAAFAAMIDGPISLWDCDFRGRTALVFGNEAAGLGSEWGNPTGEQNLTRFQIPMENQGEVDSLNVSISAAVSLYEAARQRT